MSTLVSKWLASVGIDPTLVIDEYLIDFDKKILSSPNQSKIIMGVQEGIAINTEIAIEVRALTLREKETLDALKRIKTCFPYSLACNILLSNMFWEYSSVWHNCIADLRPLIAALDVVDKIPCSHTRLSELKILFLFCY